MPCYHPLTAYHSTGGTISFDPNKSFGKSFSLQLPCGRCIGCRLEKAKEWALRCNHEASMHEAGLNNSYITLTYATEHLPKNNNLIKSEFQNFIRSLRKRTKKKIRYFMCGEYGVATAENKWIARPHFHALLFGYRFPNPKLVNIRKGNRVYTDALLTKIWGKGACEIGAVTFQSAGYVARYILKKQQGEPEEIFNRYVIINRETGEMSSRQLEYISMSLKKGIGEKWYEQNSSDCFPHDYCVLPDGRQTPVPTYYRNLLRKNDPALWEKLRLIRIEKSKNNPNNTPDRLAIRETCQREKLTRLPRNSL